MIPVKPPSYYKEKYLEDIPSVSFSDCKSSQRTIISKHSNENTTSNNLNKITNNNKTIRLPELYMDKNQIIQNECKKDYSTKITISNNKMKSEILIMFKGFLKENDYNINFSIEERDNNLIILISNEKVAKEFIDLLSISKKQNFAFKNMDFTVDIVPYASINALRTKSINPSSSTSLISTPYKRRTNKTTISVESIEKLYKGKPILSIKERKKNQNTSCDNLLYFYPKQVRSILNSAWSTPKCLSKIYKSKSGSTDTMEKYKLLPKFLNGNVPYIKHKYILRPINKEKWVSPTNFMA